MMDQRRQQLIEQYEDAALSLLMDDYANEEGERLLKEFEEAKNNGELPEMPAELDAKCRKLIDQTFAKMERKAHLKRIGQSVAKAAVLTLVLLGTVSAMAMSVEAFRVPIFNIVLHISEEYSSLFDGDSNESKTQIQNKKELLGAIIPKGYSLIIDECEEDGSESTCYQDADGNIILLDTYPYTGISNVDTEHAESRRVKLLDYDALLLIENGYRIIWIDPDVNKTFDLSATGLNLEHFLRLASALAE